MIRELKTIHTGEPAGQKRSDNDHLRFVIQIMEEEDNVKFDFTIELKGIKSWSVPEVPSMNPLEQRLAEEDSGNNFEVGLEKIIDRAFNVWDKGNYIPIDDGGNILSEEEAIKCLEEGALKFFLQGKKLVGEFVLMKKEKNDWLLMKRHDEFALYNYYSVEFTS